ncbi:hypothetical protein PSEUDO8O_120500 [Pseudomonas sp. 8O]|nr:hypothetical protein PSEUDO8O_120500 [Pseudomonas sp. 8O]
MNRLALYAAHILGIITLRMLRFRILMIMIRLSILLCVLIARALRGFYSATPASMRN